MVECRRDRKRFLVAQSMQSGAMLRHLSSEVDRLLSLLGVGGGKEAVHRQGLAKRDMCISLAFSACSSVELGALVRVSYGTAPEHDRLRSLPSFGYRA